ncbi:MAG TPA: bifunctional diguanylate cyclase/phosphodiesterase, partial [Acidimicrobiales bacterium]|nr:bifunctional diguanylate cyclase/phosphodiesterase [Acidimicrobiales bacterium]
HAVGDELLTQIGGRLASGLSHGGGEMVGRFGGDEFLALIRDRDPAAVERRVSALLADLARPATVGTARVVVGASAGLVIAGSGSTGGDAIRDADIALYRAKERQRGSLEVFRGDLRDRAVAASEIEQDLQRALADGRIHLVYQPQRSLADDRHAQVEALLRVDTPTGAVGAAPFIRIAEETALIIPIGRDVLGQAVAAARTAATLGDDVVVWVNLSVRQLFDVGLLDDVGAALDVAEIAPHQIGFEITESILIDDAAVPPVLDRLSARGHRLAIDDFGAGYSSLGYLHRLPFDVLKLDRGIVAGCDRDGPNAEIVAAVTALAHRLGLDVVAEGVETAAELEAVARLGCDHAQGFAVARPGDIDSWLTLAR